MENKDNFLSSIQVSKSNLAKAIMTGEKDKIDKVSYANYFLCVEIQKCFFFGIDSLKLFFTNTQLITAPMCVTGM